jgi:DNA-directed RNA polymerase subunit RPC12/RpoP
MTNLMTRKTKGTINEKRSTLTTTCPYCGEKVKNKVNLDTFTGYTRCNNCESRFFVNKK